MILQIVLILMELLVIFLLSRRLTQALFTIAYRITGSFPVGISFITCLLFPGTVIHELSHLFTAEILGVPTGKLMLVPTVPDTAEGKHQRIDIKTGGVQIAQTDPFRRYLIGLAPIFAGVLILSALSYFAVPLFSQIISMFFLDSPFNLKSCLLLLVSCYLIFSVSNAMFSSPRDLEGFWAFALVLTVFFAAAYVAGFRLSVTGAVAQLVGRALVQLRQTLSVVLLINIMCLIITRAIYPRVHR